MAARTIVRPSFHSYDKDRLVHMTRSGLAMALVLPLGAGLIVVGSPATGTSGPAPEASTVPPSAAVSYADEIAPIFQQYCVSCHGGEWEGEERTELSLDMTTYEGTMAGSEYGSVIEPGDPDNSLLLEMIEDGDMPEEGDPVPPEDIEKIRTWIAEGAENN